MYADDAPEHASDAAWWEAQGLPAPPPTHAKRDWDISWAAVVASVGETDVHKVDTAACPLCSGAGRLRFVMAGGASYVPECPACEGLGYLPTKRGVRRLEAAAIARIKRLRVERAGGAQVVRVLRMLADDPDAYGGGELWLHRNSRWGAPAPGSERVRVDNDPAMAALFIADGEAALRDVDAELELQELSVGQLAQLHRLVHKASSTRGWLDRVSAAVQAQQVAPPVPSEPVAAPAPARCHCGRAGTVQQGDGTWLCKRHAYEAGAIEHTAEQLRATEVVHVCDFCEERRARRLYDDCWYCGPCAEEADLPPAEAA